ncbi:MAG: hypothetical protein AB7U62_04015 [Pseudolabrys sp.]
MWNEQNRAAARETWACVKPLAVAWTAIGALLITAIAPLTLKSLDYWLNRYQTLLAAIIAGAIAAIAVRPVLGQLAEMRTQNDHIALERWRERSIQIAKEGSELTGAENSVRMTFTAFRLLAIKANRSDLRGALAHLESCVLQLEHDAKVFNDDISPMWGTADVHAVRTSTSSNLAQFVAGARTQLMLFHARGEQIDIPMDTMDAMFEPWRANFMEGAAILVKMIDEERATISRNIDALERTLRAKS